MNKMNHKRTVVVISALMIVLVIVGEIAVYGPWDGRYSTDASFDGNILTYSVHAGGSKEYSVIVSDNGIGQMDELYIYYDRSYPSALNDPAGAPGVTQEAYVGSLMNSLRLRGMTDIKILNAHELGDSIADDIAGTTISKGLVVLSGAFPDTVYTGIADDEPIFKWLDGGGRLYWAGNIIGKYVAEKGGIREADDQELFFTADCLNMGESNIANLPVADDPYRSALSLVNNRVAFGLNASMLTVRNLAVGYSDGIYASIVLTEYGNGMVCVFGGGLSYEQQNDMAQVIASNICHSSALIGSPMKSIVKGSAGSSIDIGVPTSILSVYIYIGGSFPVYGQSYSFV